MAKPLFTFRSNRSEEQYENAISENKEEEKKKKNHPQPLVSPKAKIHANYRLGLPLPFCQNNNLSMNNAKCT